MTSRRQDVFSQNVSVRQLLRLSVAPAASWIRRCMLQARLRSLQRLADYFEWQEANGREGLADTHRSIALVKSDLNTL